jgi:quercetin dioxygenase-like cupin family protein
MIIRAAAGLAEFRSEKMGKVTLAAGQHLYAGLNCFLPGQEHKAHVHADQDKLYLVLSGTGEAEVGETKEAVSAGDLILAEAGVSHGLKNTSSEPFTVLVVFGPPPAKG